MNREKMAWLVSVGLIALLAFHLPGTLAQRDDDYKFVRTLVDIHRQVSQNYADPPDEGKLREAAINGMLAELDPYTMYVPPSRQEEFDRMLDGSFKGVGIQLDQKEDQGNLIEVVTPIDGSPAFKAGVMAGDVILKVNGESIEGLRLEDVVKKIGGQLGTEVTLTVKHATGETEDLTMTREQIVVPTIKGYQRTPDNKWDYYVAEEPKIAYVRVTQFTEETFDALKGALEELLKDGMEGLILDLRFNPGGRLDQAINVVDLFLEEGVVVSTRGRNRPEQVAQATVPGTLPEFPMIVLVNEGSASASEIVAGSLKDNRRAVVVGTRTYGKGSVQELIPLDNNGGELKLTVAYYYLPSGRLVHRKKDATDWGVEPNIIVPMTPEQEQRAMRERYEQELFRRPLPKVSATQQATQPTTAAAATQPVDAQLQRAVDTLIALLVLQGDDKPAGAGGPATLPAGVQPLRPSTGPSPAIEFSPEPVPTTRPAATRPAATRPSPTTAPTPE
jgi:carboxyl-terminal processing protease